MATPLDSSSSQPPQATTDGGSTSSPKSAASSKKKRNGNIIFTITQEREIARLYRERAGTAKEIAAAFGVHQSTIYSVLHRQKVGVHYPLISRASSRSMSKTWEKKRQPEIEPHLLAEQPSPIHPPLDDGVNIDAVHQKQSVTVEPARAKRKYTRRKKNWFQRMWSRYFG